MRDFNRWMTWVAIFVSAAFLQSPVLLAEESPIDDLESMSLQELLEINVVTPAAKAQSAAESPAVISVLNASQIRDLGVQSLYEALSYLPGVQVSESYFGYTMVNVRGVLENHYNNRVLLMVNGHPTREVVNGSFHLEIVPINVVERIEFVRGPASALYGTNAFAGVINIITASVEGAQAREISVGGGSFGTWEASANFGGVVEGLEYLVAASMHDDDGYPFVVDGDERGESGEIDYENDVGNAMVSLKYGDFSFLGAYFSQDKKKFGIIPVVALDGTAHYQGLLLDLGWSHEWQGGSHAGVRLRYDSTERKNHMGQLPFPGYLGHADASTVANSGGHLWGAEVTAGHRFSDRFSLLSGVVYERRESDPYIFRFEDDDSIHPSTAFAHTATARNLAVFGQGTLRLSDRADAVIGVRYVEDSDAGSSFVPRLGLVYRVGAQSFLKLLAAEAYRSPDFFEQEVETVDVLFGDTGLEPERTRNYDLAFDTTFGEQLNLKLDAFYLTTYDLIIRVPTTRPDVTGPDATEYANGSGQNIWGLEAALLAEPHVKLRFFANYSYCKGRWKESREDLVYIANHTANLGLVWKAAPWIGVKPNIQFVGDRGAADSYVLANLILDFKLGHGFDLELIGRNLGDEDYSYPEYIRGTIDVIPGGPGRSFYARFRWRPPNGN